MVGDFAITVDPSNWIQLKEEAEEKNPVCFDNLLLILFCIYINYENVFLNEYIVCSIYCIYSCLTKSLVVPSKNYLPASITRDKKVLQDGRHQYCL